MTEIRELYQALAKQSLDIHEYSGRLRDVVFEIFTADSYVAGIASKLQLRGYAVNVMRYCVRAIVMIPRVQRRRSWHNPQRRDGSRGPRDGARLRVGVSF